MKKETEEPNEEEKPSMNQPRRLAFARSAYSNSNDRSGLTYCESQSGMELRDYFAIEFAKELLVYKTDNPLTMIEGDRLICARAAELADLLIATLHPE